MYNSDEERIEQEAQEAGVLEERDINDSEQTIETPPEASEDSPAADETE